MATLQSRLYRNTTPGLRRFVLCCSCLMVTLGYYHFGSRKPMISTTEELSPVSSEIIRRLPPSYSHAIVYYEQLGYQYCARQSQLQTEKNLWLHLRVEIDSDTCSAYFEEFVSTYQVAPDWPPPREIPASLKDRYLMHGRMQQGDWYFAQRYDGEPEARFWSPEVVKLYMDRAASSEHFTYGPETNYIYKVLEDHPLDGQTGIVVGSETPWLEAILLAKGRAAKILTVEFLPINSTFPQIEYLSPMNFSNSWRSTAARKVDFAFTYSSLEHTGLGRYGDRLDPDGDIKEMRKLSCVLRDGALVFLGLPFGVDTVYWNAHRIYGPWRLPLMTANFDVLGLYTDQRLADAFAFVNSTEARPRAYTQAVIVMRKTHAKTKC